MPLDRTEEHVNRAVLERLGLGPKALSNAMTHGHMDWLARSIYRPYHLDARDFVCIAVWVSLTQHTRLTRAQAGAVCASLRTGIDYEP
jgi:hypothetical protein